MGHQRKPSFTCAAVLLALSASTQFACAQQSLSMSYALGASTTEAPREKREAPQCSGWGWISSVAACSRDWLSSRRKVEESASAEHAAPERWARAPASTDIVVPGREAPVAELPDLGEATPERILRSGGGREALLSNTRTADLLLRLGSKYRFRSAEEGGWEYYRFTDTTYQTHLHNKGHKAVGVELFVPFH